MKTQLCILSVLVCLTMSCPDSSCQSKSVNAAALPKIRPAQPMLDQISMRGRDLFEYEKVSIVGTDALLAKIKPPPDKFDYYVAARSSDGWRLYFGKLNTSKSEFAIWYEVNLTGGAPQVSLYDQPKVDTGGICARARAVAVCLPLSRRTGATMNYAVLPESADKYFVYVYPGTNKPGTYLLGGDVRYLVSGTDGKILVTKQLHRGVTEYPSQDLPKGSEPVSGMHSAIMDDVPEDTDVLHVLLRRPQLPEYVLTEHWLYQVNEDGSIRFVSEAPQNETKPAAKSTKTQKKN